MSATNVLSNVEVRSRGIGGSDAPVLLGFYGCRGEMYLEKIGELVKPEPTRIQAAKMKAGKRFEATIAALYEEETGRRIRRVKATLVHPDYDFVRGNVDRMIVGDERGPGVLEVKNTSSMHVAKWEREGFEIPPPYYAQLQHYLLVTGYRWGAIAMLVDGWDFRHFPVAADPEFQRELLLMEISFWIDHVVARVPPAPVSVEDVLALFPRSTPGLRVVATEEIAEKARRLREIRNLTAVPKELEKEDKALADELKVAMGGAEELIDEEGYVLATYKSAKDSRKFNEAKLQSENPELFERYVEAVPGSRRFLLKV